MEKENGSGPAKTGLISRAAAAGSRETSEPRTRLPPHSLLERALERSKPKTETRREENTLHLYSTVQRATRTRLVVDRRERHKQTFDARSIRSNAAHVPNAEVASAIE